MDNLATLIEEHEDWLIDRVVHYAHEHDFTRYTSTLREAWRASICGLSEPIVAVLAELREGSAPEGQLMQAAVEFGVEEAVKHRMRGVGLTQFLGLLKLYRRAYFDLVEENVEEPERRRWLVSLLLVMFDSIEIGLAREWTESTGTNELDALNEENRALSNEKNKYLTVFESIADPVILLDAEHRPLHMNAIGGRLLLGETSPGAGYYGEKVDPRLDEIVDQILDRADPVIGAVGRITLDSAKGKRTFNIAVQDMLDISRKFSGRVIILNDVTDLLAALETAQVADRAKSSFLATVSHEIKTPINAISGLAELFDGGSLAPEHQRYLNGIRVSVGLLHELTENILGLSRSEANALQIVEQDFDICDQVETLVEMFAPAARQRGVVIEHQIAPDLPCGVRGDENKLRHVLMNLLSNAAKFTLRGSVRLRVSVAASATPEVPRLRFEVADTGVGLPPGEIDWLFEPFTQYPHPNVIAPVRGTGLGLAICKRMVAFLGGTISARPNPGGGSIFEFELPLALARKAAGTGELELGLAVLVVEDDPASAIVAEGYLRELKQKPFVAHSYGEAMKALGRQRFDMVLTDHRLGDAVGLDLARALRASPDPVLKAMPVVLVTANTLVDTFGASGAPEIDLFIEKPFARNQLRRALRQVAGLRERRRASQADEASASMPEAAPLLDSRVLNQLLTDLGFERTTRIIKSYLDTAPKLQRSMAVGIRGGDFVATAEAAHQLVSAASYVGLASLVRTARALHTACAARETKAAHEIHSRLDALCAQANAELETFWSRTAADFHADFS